MAKKISSAKHPTAQAVRRMLGDLPQKVGASAMTAAASAAASTQNTVAFACNNPTCIVGLKIVGVPGVTFVSNFGLTLPAGTRGMAWKVKSNPQGQPFSVTVSGGSTDQPISGVTGPNAGGVVQLTVP